jgi:REP element-mobilizing transposase RayT
VFVTQYRRGALTDAMLITCEQAMRETCEDFGLTLVEFNGEDDYVHLLINFPPTVQLFRLVNSLKGCVLPDVAPEASGTGQEIPVGEPLLVALLLCRYCWWCAGECHP